MFFLIAGSHVLAPIFFPLGDLLFFIVYHVPFGTNTHFFGRRLKKCVSAECERLLVAAYYALLLQYY